MLFGIKTEIFLILTVLIIILSFILYKYILKKEIVTKKEIITKNHPGKSLTDKFPLLYYENLFTKQECEDIIKESSVFGLTNSQLTVYAEGYRTSKTAHMTDDNKITKLVFDRIKTIMNIDKCYAEPMQLQKYEVGQEFKEHSDYFQESVEVEKEILNEGGQRTWTFMIYLNDTEEGGETIFHKLGFKIKPRKGSAIAWYNLNEDGSGNDNTMHSGSPIIKGEKYVITQWFRDKPSMCKIYSPTG